MAGNEVQESKSDDLKLNEVDEKSQNIYEKIVSKKFLRTALIAFLLAVFIKSLLIEAYKIPTGSMENTLLVGDFIIVNKAAYKISTPRMLPFTDIEIPHFRLFSTDKPKRGDVIVFNFPGYPNELHPYEPANYIKRIVGLPGDTVKIINKNVFINGKLIEPPPHALLNSKVLPFGKRDNRIYPNDVDWNRDNFGPLYIPRKGDKLKITAKNINRWEALIDREFGKKAVSVEGTVITINGTPVREYTLKDNYYFVMGDNRDDSMDSRYWGYVPGRSILGKADMIYWSWDPYISYSHVFQLFHSIRFNRIFTLIK